MSQNERTQPAITRRADQYDADTLTLEELTAILRGPAGSSVGLWLGSPTENGPARRVELERRSLPQPAIKQARTNAHLILPPFVYLKTGRNNRIT